VVLQIQADFEDFDPVLRSKSTEGFNVACQFIERYLDLLHICRIKSVIKAQSEEQCLTELGHFLC
jgi:hypothetical protein